MLEAPLHDAPASLNADVPAVLAQLAAQRNPVTAYDVVKRLIDLALGGLMLVVTLPVMAVVAVLCRLDSPGPVLFRQQRIARGGRLFTLYKFRTMWADSRERFPELFDFSFAGATADQIFLQHAVDPRVTRLGHFLRRTSLDELPNLFNVVRGELSLVGPRPEIAEVLPHYTSAQLAKFAVKPGLTGLAQITGRGALSLEATLAADLEYCARRSTAFDLWILLATVREVVRGAGAF
jgi:lipopolysaccharide/colanic/teichoic acid biosynthesis glycosyltransferase